jgi:diguanylate cyclase
MKQKTSESSQNPTEIAREVFRLLAQRRAAPTPDIYKSFYYEVAGIAEPTDPISTESDAETASVLAAGDDTGATTVLAGFATRLASAPGELGDYGNRFLRDLKAGNWDNYDHNLAQLADKYLTDLPATSTVPIPGTVAALSADSRTIEQLRDLLVRTLSFGMASLLQDVPELATESEALSQAVKSAQSEDELDRIGTRLKQLCYQIEMKTGSMGEQQELLLRLFNLLLDNVGELLEDDSWLRGQIEVIQNLTSGPLNYRMLEDAVSSLKEVIYKQGLLKHSLTEAKGSIKNMMMTFIDRLGGIAASTGSYHEKIDHFSRKISRADNILELNDVLEEMLRETRIVQAEALNSRDQMIAARREVHDAEARIKELEAKLDHMSELVREDQLTGSLNRKGLDDVFEREVARSERRGTPLCVAMLDLDNFKALNDKYGHFAGDEALIHLVRVVKNTLRPTDVIARFGGEEFVILLPETRLEDATDTMKRLQRELTKHFFLYKNERMLITFSAGVTSWQQKEEQSTVVARADKAMYKAKKAGKNRVMAAE